MKSAQAPEGYIVGTIIGPMVESARQKGIVDGGYMSFEYMDPSGKRQELPHLQLLNLFSLRARIRENQDIDPESVTEDLKETALKLREKVERWKKEADQQLRELERMFEQTTEVLDAILNHRLKFLIALNSKGGSLWVYEDIAYWIEHGIERGGEVECYGMENVESGAFRTWMQGSIRHGEEGTKFSSHFSSLIRDAIKKIEEGVNVDENRRKLSDCLAIEKEWLLAIWGKIPEDHPRREEILSSIRESDGNWDLTLNADEMKELGLLNGTIFPKGRDSLEHLEGQLS